jgi:MFS family permease
MSLEATLGDHRPARWYHGWNIVAACVLAQTGALALTINCFSLFLPQWTREFGVPVSELTLAVTFFSFGTAALAYLIGVCADRYPARWLFGGGLGAIAVAHLLIARSEAAWQILAIYMVLLPFAIGFSTAVPSQSLVSRWFVRRAGLAMGITSMGLSVAGALFPPIVVFLLPIVGWRAIWTAAAGIILLIVLPLVLLTVRDRPHDEDPRSEVRPRGGAASKDSLGFAGIVRRRNFWVVIIAFLSASLISSTITFTVTPIILSHGGTAAGAGIFLSVLSVTAIGAKLVAGWLCDRMGVRVPLAIVVSAGGLCAIALGIPKVEPLYLAGVAMLAGTAAGVWTLLAASMLAEFGPASFGRAFGIACATSPIGTLGPPLVARIQEASGSYSTPLSALGALAFVAAGGVLLFYRAPSRPDQIQTA